VARIAILVTAALLAVAPAMALADDAADLAAREKKMMELSRRGAWAEALVEARAALKLSRKLLGDEHLRVATHHANVADLLARTGKLAAAEGHYRRAARIQAAARGEDHFETGLAVLSLAQAQAGLGKREDAARGFERALAIFIKSRGAEDGYVGRALMLLGRVRGQMGEPAKALEHLERALSITEKVVGREHTAVAEILFDAAEQHGVLGRARRAVPLLSRAVAIFDKAHGPEDALSLDALGRLAWWQREAGQYPAALASYRALLARQQKKKAAPGDGVAIATINIALVLKKMGKLAEATARYRDGLALLEKIHGKRHSSVATALDNLANVLMDRGEYREARELLDRAVPMWKALRGRDHVDTAVSMMALAVLLKEMGDLAGAQPVAQEALDIFKRVEGDTGERTAVAMDNLASIHADLGRYDRAEPLYRKALEIHVARRGPDHPTVAIGANNIGWLLRMVGKPREALPFYERALRINTRSVGSRHPSVAANLAQIGLTHLALGDVGAARRHLTRARRIDERALGKSHPNLGFVLSSLAEVEARAGKLARARSLGARALAIVEGHLEPLLYATSQRERLELVGRHRSAVHHYLSLHDRPTDAVAAYQRVLRWKGIVLTSMIAQRQALLAASSPAIATPLAELADVRTELANLAMAIPEPGARARTVARIARLTRKKDRLERQLSRSSAAFAAAQREVSAGFGEVCAALAGDEALVDYLRYVRTDRAGARSWHLAAFVTAAGRCARPIRVELGPAAPIDKAVRGFRLTVDSREGTGEIRALGDRVRRLIWDAVAAALAGKTRIWVSTDGSLNGVPLAALPRGEDGYLIEGFTFSYLASGKDLVRERQRLPAGRSLIVGGIRYGADKSKVKVRNNAQGCGIQSRPRYDYLAGTRSEAKAIAAALGGSGQKVTSLSGAAASEQAIKKLLASSRTAHLATHGFFAPPCAAAPDRADALEAAVSNPLVRSGIVLAGANKTRGRLTARGDDGVLTAEEVAELDLRGLDLAVLSACETGLGDVRSGEGVLGLRWAFSIAGARALLMSLWKVPDDETRELMEAFYRRIRRSPGIDRAGALRAAQLAMLRARRAEGDADPWSWAAFILSGR
jgi:CHAT domain-containing protein/Tfp pilus assembly protein PilF